MAFAGARSGRMEARIDGWMDTEGEKLSFFSVHNPLSTPKAAVRTKPGSFKEMGSAPKSKPRRCLSTLLKRQAPFPRKQISPPRHSANLFPSRILIYSPGRRQAHRLHTEISRLVLPPASPVGSPRLQPSGERGGKEFGVGHVILFQFHPCGPVLPSMRQRGGRQVGGKSLC